ncbi:MAG: hypothetical protein HYU59_07355 [Magnetospirillum gryphiswaldense]|nr:hypothetical protein [Magnetospirillum gryphiswaldense]
MFRKLTLIALSLSAAMPVWAGEAVRPRLVPGGGGVALPVFSGENKSEVYSTGGFSLGAVSAPMGGVSGNANGDGLAVGGYAAYGMDWMNLSSSVKSGGGVGTADLTASRSVSPLGLDGVAALSLGYQWTQVGGFSLNPAQMGVSPGDANDLSLSLSFTHDVTPSFSMGGFAAASRGEDAASQPNSGLHFGAGLELKF